MDVSADLLQKVVEALVYLSNSKVCTEGVNPIQELENRLIEQSREYFTQQADKMINSCSLVEYMELADRILQQEKARFSTYLVWEKVEQKILAEFQQQVLIKHQSQLLLQNGALLSLFKEQKSAELSLIHSLYSPIVDGLKSVSEKFKLYMVEQGRSIIENCETQKAGKELSAKEILTSSNLIEQLGSSLQIFQTFVKVCFKGDSAFSRQVQLALQDYMNLDVGKHSMAELLASHIDKIFKKGGIRNSGANSIDEIIEQQVALFTFLIDKDLYLEVYRNQLARRLLQEKIEDMDAEKQMITNLKLNCGLAQIKKLEGMLVDLQKAKDDIKEFE